MFYFKDHRKVFLLYVEAILETDSTLVRHSTVYDRNSALHIAAANGQMEILSFLLDRPVKPDLLNRHKQILIFDSVNGRTCLHYAAYYGHSGCLQVILSAAQTSHVAASWGYSCFVNVRDHKGATPLHLAACQRRPECVHMLLYDHDTFSMDDKMGDAKFDIKPFIEALKIHPEGPPNGKIITKLQPCRSNCLAEESSVVWRDRKVIQEMSLGCPSKTP